VALGGTPLGAPIVGWVADRFGPRWALSLGAAAGLAAAAVAMVYLVRHRHLRAHIRRGMLRIQYDSAD
jgi:MFS family permease